MPHISSRKADERPSQLPALVCANSPFRRFGPMREQEVRKEVVTKDERMERLVQVWKAFECKFPALEENYQTALLATGDFLCTARELEIFVTLLPEFQNERDFERRSGLFISVLVNAGVDLDYVVRTDRLEKKIDCFGYHNTKNIISEGDVGHWAGRQMKDGTLTIKGNVGDWAGDMLEGGNLTIEGDIGGFVGVNMKGGIIHLEGNYESLSPRIQGGHIYHKGVLIYPRLN